MLLSGFPYSLQSAITITVHLSGSGFLCYTSYLTFLKASSFLSEELSRCPSPYPCGQDRTIVRKEPGDDTECRVNCGQKRENGIMVGS